MHFASLEVLCKHSSIYNNKISSKCSILQFWSQGLPLVVAVNQRKARDIILSLLNASEWYCVILNGFRQVYHVVLFVIKFVGFDIFVHTPEQCQISHKYI